MPKALCKKKAKRRVIWKAIAQRHTQKKILLKALCKRDRVQRRII